MKESLLAPRTCQLRGGVDVGVYHTLLDPDFALNVEAEGLTDEAEQALWRNFDLSAYQEKILELAMPELTALLAKLPEELHVQLIPDSAFIFSPHDYSYGNDELRFSIHAQSSLTPAEMQNLLDKTVYGDWHSEFGSHYRISEKLAENYSIYDFQRKDDELT